MRETYYIGAYWGNRFESRDACTDRLFQTVTELATCHELLANWYRPAGSLKKALQRQVTPARDVLEQLLKPHKPDEPDPVAEQEFLEAMGYSYYFWNGQVDDEQAISLNGSCGGAIDVPSISNTVVLDLADVCDATVSLYEPDALLRMLRVIVDAWDPDSGGVIDCKYRDEYVYPYPEIPPAGKPYVGWMTYLRDKRLSGLKGTPPCEVFDIPGRGKIFIITREHRFSVENPDDLAAAQALTEYLETCGALVPIPTNEPF